jgi:hypothetical protein
MIIALDPGVTICPLASGDDSGTDEDPAPAASALPVAAPEAELSDGLAVGEEDRGAAVELAAVVGGAVLNDF